MKYRIKQGHYNVDPCWLIYQGNDEKELMLWKTKTSKQVQQTTTESKVTHTKNLEKFKKR